MPNKFPFVATCDRCRKNRRRCSPLTCCSACEFYSNETCVWESGRTCERCLSAGQICEPSLICKRCQRYKNCHTVKVASICAACETLGIDCNWCWCRNFYHCRNCHDNSETCRSNIKTKLIENQEEEDQRSREIKQLIMIVKKQIDLTKASLESLESELHLK